MKKLLMTLIFVMAFAVSGYAQQVVDEKPITGPAVIMMNSLTCGYCQQFLGEAMPEWSNFQQYHKEKYNLIIPNLYILDMPPEREYPQWWVEKDRKGLIPGVKGTPTFFLWDGEQVIDKVVGYDINKIFVMLHEIIQKHDPDAKQHKHEHNKEAPHNPLN